MTVYVIYLSLTIAYLNDLNITLDHLDSEGVRLNEMVTQLTEPPSVTNPVCEDTPIEDNYYLQLCKVYKSCEPHFEALMTLGQSHGGSAEIGSMVFSVGNILLLKMLYEYAIGSFDDMNSTLLCYLDYCRGFTRSNTALNWTIGRGSLVPVYDAIYKYDLLKFVSKTEIEPLYSLLLAQTMENQIARVVEEDLFDDMDAFIEEVFSSSNFILRSASRIYTVEFFKRREKVYLRRFVDHLLAHLENGGYYTNYEHFSISRVGWMPGRLYSQYIIQLTEHFLVYDYTLKNRALVLLWALLTYSHKEATSTYPETLEDIVTHPWFNEHSLRKPRLTSFITGSPLVLQVEDKHFLIDGLPGPQAISEQDEWRIRAHGRLLISEEDEQFRDSVYVGCL